MDAVFMFEPWPERPLRKILFYLSAEGAGIQLPPNSVRLLK
jgi:hypothetical protein